VEAIDKGYKSFLGKTFDVNHNTDIPGKIIDVKREGELAFFKSEGLDADTLSVMNSKFYRGVSQNSINLKSEMNGDHGEVKEFDGIKMAVVTWPHSPGCPISFGCGIPIASTISNQLNSTQEGDDMDYTKNQMKEMLAYMRDHPDMMDEGMREMMAGMMGNDKSETTKSTVTVPHVVITPPNKTKISFNPTKKMFEVM